MWAVKGQILIKYNSFCVTVKENIALQHIRTLSYRAIAIGGKDTDLSASILHDYMV